MRAAIFEGPGRIGVGDLPDPAIQAPTDAIVRVVLACVCGSDLWYYRGDSPHTKGGIGHEFVGIVEQVGTDVRTRPRRHRGGLCRDGRSPGGEGADPGREGRMTNREGDG